MRIRLPLLLVILGACGGGGGDDGDDTAGGDAPMADSPMVPAMITITGTATERSALGSNPVEGAMIGAYRNGSDSAPVTMTTTDASGNYTLVVTTNGQALDGYIKATSAGLLDTYLYPPYALVADFSGASVNMLAAGTLDTLYGLCSGGGISPDPARGTVAVAVYDSAMQPVAGAMVTGNPAPEELCYNGGNGLPDGGATMTNADGIAYMLNAPTGQVTVGAMGGGTFRSHAVTVRTNALTTTPVVP